MDVLDILEAEEHRLQAEARGYRQRLEGLPKGCFTVKTISGRPYAYVAARVMGKVRFTYVGRADGGEAGRMRRKLQLSRKYKTALRRCEQELQRVQRARAPLRAVDRPEINHELARRLPAPSRRDFGEIGPAVRGSMTMMKGQATVRWLGS